MSAFYLIRQVGKPIKFINDAAIPANLLVVFVALGILLILVLITAIVYFIIRISRKKGVSEKKVGKSESATADRQKSSIKSQPVRTTLKDGFYEIEAFINSSDNVNQYRIRRTQPLYLCPHCHVELKNDSAAFCRVCGTALDVIPPSYTSYLLRETTNASLFETEQRLIGMNLRHASLILPVDAFSEEVSGITHSYLIEPFEQKPTLLDSTLPLPVEKVLDIGISLAEGLAYLHNYSAALNDLHLENVFYSDHTAKWLCYHNVDLISSENKSEFDQRYTANVRDLIQLLNRLLVGIESVQSLSPIPDEVQELFRHYMTENVDAEQLTRSLRQANRMLGGHNVVQFYIGKQTDVGQLRQVNEDSLILRDLSAQYGPKGLSMVIGGVADGVGGQEAGDVASQMTVQTLESHIDKFLNDVPIESLPESSDWLAQAAISANEIVYHERNNAGNNMASTLVLAMFTGDLCTILNVGDSRAYLMNKRGIRQITTDHSLVERLVAIGEITREEARHHPRKSVIYRVIGDRLNLDYDIFTHIFEPGDALLMCSDGLSDMVEDATIWRIWRSASSPQDAADQLVAEANTAGGTDNITVVIIAVAG